MEQQYSTRRQALRQAWGVVGTGILMTGCATTPGEPPPIDRYRSLMRVAVSLATDRLLTQHPTLAPLMLQTATVLGDVFDAGEFTSIDAVVAFIRSRIPWDKVEPDARPAVEALLVGIGEELRMVAMQHEIPQTQAIVLVKDILAWVAEVARRHVVAPVRVRFVK